MNTRARERRSWARSRRPLAMVVLVVAVLGGCSGRRKAAPTTKPVATTAPVQTAGSPFSRPDLGIQLTPPASWRPEPSADYVLVLRPSNAVSQSAPTLSLDVPELPFHIPGMIPIAAVRSGYLDDLRKQVGPLTTEDLPPPDLGGATARLVRSSWHAPSGETESETALMLVHADRVYILRARTDAAHEAEAKAAFDALVQSLRWVK